MAWTSRHLDFLLGASAEPEGFDILSECFASVVLARRRALNHALIGERVRTGLTLADHGCSRPRLRHLHGSVDLVFTRASARLNPFLSACLHDLERLCIFSEVFGRFVVARASGTSLRATCEVVWSAGAILPDGGARRSMLQRLELSVRIVTIVTVVDDFLFGLGLAEAEPFDVLTEVIAGFILAGPSDACLRLVCEGARSARSVFPDGGTRRLVPRLRELLLRGVVIVAVVDDQLLCLGLAKTEAFLFVLSKLDARVVGSGTQISSRGWHASGHISPARLAHQGRSGARAGHGHGGLDLLHASTHLCRLLLLC